MILVVTFYKFVSFPDFAEKQITLLSYCQAQEVKGTILLAKEGINGTIAGLRDNVESVLSFLRFDPRLTDLEHKESYTDTLPFERMKVRFKPEIVTLGLPEVDPNQQVGTYVSPQDWNDLISDPEFTVIDTRNDYEVNIGTFQKAQNPQTETFRQFPDYVRDNLDPGKHKKVALFCTGGIRCEKASSFLLAQGFEQVYHLKGGILKYLEEVPTEESLWEGECFVFDERVAVRHNLEQGACERCSNCGNPIYNEEKTSPKYELGISCSHCFDRLTEDKRLRLQQKLRQLELAKKRAGSALTPKSNHQQWAQG
jgi:UPF0176 protein